MCDAVCDPLRIRLSLSLQAEGVPLLAVTQALWSLNEVRDLFTPSVSSEVADMLSTSFQAAIIR